MEIVFVIMGVVAIVSFYDHFTTKNWQSITSASRNEAVFENRNKNYGAYTLRRDYNKRMLFVLLGVVCTLGLMSFSFLYAKGIAPESKLLADYENDTIQLAFDDEPKVLPSKPEVEPQTASSSPSVLFIAPIIVDDFVDDNIHIQDDLMDSVAGNRNNDGNDDWGKVPPGNGNDSVTVLPPPPPIPPIHEFLEEDAEFIGGYEALQLWISKHVEYPADPWGTREQGKVYASFVVEPDGSITNVQIERGVSDELDKETKRLIRSMPRWKPGKINGAPVRARCRLPVNYTL